MARDGRLPAGKTCADCMWMARCRMLFGCNPTNTECDWIPHRFSDAVKAEKKEIAATRRQEGGE